MVVGRGVGDRVVGRVGSRVGGRAAGGTVFFLFLQWQIEI